GKLAVALDAVEALRRVAEGEPNPATTHVASAPAPVRSCSCRRAIEAGYARRARLALQHVKLSERDARRVLAAELCSRRLDVCATRIARFGVDSQCRVNGYERIEQNRAVLLQLSEVRRLFAP